MASLYGYKNVNFSAILLVRIEVFSGFSFEASCKNHRISKKTRKAVYLIGFMLPLLATLISYSGLFRYIRTQDFTIDSKDSCFLNVNPCGRQHTRNVRRHTSDKFSNWCFAYGALEQMRAPKSRAETPAVKSFFQFENSSELNSENVTDLNS